MWPHSLYRSTNLHIGQVPPLFPPPPPFSLSSIHTPKHPSPKTCPQAVITGTSTFPSTFAEWYGWMHIRHVTRGFVSGGWEVLRSAWHVCLLPCVCRARIWSRVSPWAVGVEGGGSWIVIVGDSFRCEEERRRGLDGQYWMSRFSAIRSCGFERCGIEGRARHRLRNTSASQR